MVTDLPFQPSRVAVERLLAQSNLPTANLTPALLQYFLAYGTPEDPAGVVGLELHGPVALLRSLAVAANHRGAGLGEKLVAAAAARASSRRCVRQARYSCASA